MGGHQQQPNPTSCTLYTSSMKSIAFPTSDLCPNAHIVEHVRRSATWHVSSGSVRSAKLLLSFRKPHQPVTSPTAARWLNTILHEASIYHCFLAHFTRGASTSAAAKGGMSTNAIFSTTEWCQASTFRQFYHRSAESPSAQELFISAILQLVG